MANQPRSWEGIFFTLVITFTILIGCAYVLAINYQLPIPWLVILIFSIVITAASQIARERRARRDSK